MPGKVILRTYIRAGKLCPDFFFHEQLAGLYAREKEAKSRYEITVYNINIETFIGLQINLLNLQKLNFDINSEFRYGVY